MGTRSTTFIVINLDSCDGHDNTAVQTAFSDRHGEDRELRCHYVSVAGHNPCRVRNGGCEHLPYRAAWVSESLRSIVVIISTTYLDNESKGGYHALHGSLWDVSPLLKRRTSTVHFPVCCTSCVWLVIAAIRWAITSKHTRVQHHRESIESSVSPIVSW